MKEKNTLLLPVVASLVLGAALGYGGATMMRTTPAAGPTQADLTAAGKAGFDAGYESAKADANAIFVEKGLSSPLDQPILQVNGFITAVHGDEYEIEYDSAQLTVFDKGKKTLTFKVGSGTTLMKIVDAKTSTKTTTAAPVPGGGEDASSGPPGSPPPKLIKGPISQTMEPASASDLKVGAYVQIKSATDVREAGVIMATEVLVYNDAHLAPDTPPPTVREFNGPSSGAPIGAPPTAPSAPSGTPSATPTAPLPTPGGTGTGGGDN